MSPVEEGSRSLRDLPPKSANSPSPSAHQFPLKPKSDSMTPATSSAERPSQTPPEILDNGPMSQQDAVTSLEATPGVSPAALPSMSQDTPGSCASVAAAQPCPSPYASTPKLPFPSLEPSSLSSPLTSSPTCSPQDPNVSLPSVPLYQPYNCASSKRYPYGSTSTSAPYLHLPNSSTIPIAPPAPPNSQLTSASAQSVGSVAMVLCSPPSPRSSIMSGFPLAKPSPCVSGPMSTQRQELPPCSSFGGAPPGSPVESLVTNFGFLPGSPARHLLLSQAPGLAMSPSPHLENQMPPSSPLLCPSSPLVLMSTPAPALEDLEAHYTMLGTVIGEGKFGQVRPALDRATGEVLACKAMSKRRMSEAGVTALMRQEVSAMERLRQAGGHRNVVMLQAKYEDDANLCLLMDMCEDGELYQEIVRRGGRNERFMPTEAGRAFYQIVSGVAFCHANGVVHRDLKPENILLSRLKPNTVLFAAPPSSPMVAKTAQASQMCASPFRQSLPVTPPRVLASQQCHQLRGEFHSATVQVVSSDTSIIGVEASGSGVDHVNGVNLDLNAPVDQVHSGGTASKAESTGVNGQGAQVDIPDPWQAKAGEKRARVQDTVSLKFFSKGGGPLEGKVGDPGGDGGQDHGEPDQDRATELHSTVKTHNGEFRIPAPVPHNRLRGTPASVPAKLRGGVPSEGGVEGSTSAKSRASAGPSGILRSQRKVERSSPGKWGSYGARSRSGKRPRTSPIATSVVVGGAEGSRESIPDGDRVRVRGGRTPRSVRRCLRLPGSLGDDGTTSTSPPLGTEGVHVGEVWGEQGMDLHGCVGTQGATPGSCTESANNGGECGGVEEGTLHPHSAAASVPLPSEGGGLDQGTPAESSAAALRRVKRRLIPQGETGDVESPAGAQSPGLGILHGENSEDVRQHVEAGEGHVAMLGQQPPPPPSKVEHVLKLADFGLALLLEGHEKAVGAAGSPMYMAPETYSGEYDCKADIWSTGVILYILLCGHHPFPELGRSPPRQQEGEVASRGGDICAERDAYGCSNELKFDDYGYPMLAWPAQGEGASGVDAIPESAKGLVKSLLHRNPLKRPTAKKVLTHPWLLQCVYGGIVVRRRGLSPMAQKSPMKGAVCRPTPGKNLFPVMDALSPARGPNERETSTPNQRQNGACSSEELFPPSSPWSPAALGQSSRGNTGRPACLGPRNVSSPVEQQSNGSQSCPPKQLRGRVRLIPLSQFMSRSGPGVQVSQSPSKAGQQPGMPPLHPNSGGGRSTASPWKPVGKGSLPQSRLSRKNASVGP